MNGWPNGNRSLARLALRLIERPALALHDALSWKARELTGDERLDARLVFGDSVDLTAIRIVSTWIANSPVALGNTIRVGGHGLIDRATLIHELAHVWQFQTQGSAYVSDSVYHQMASVIRTGSRASAYALGDLDLSVNSIRDLPAEKQAVIIECYFADPMARRDHRFQRFIAEVRSSRPTQPERAS